MHRTLRKCQSIYACGYISISNRPISITNRIISIKKWTPWLPHVNAKSFCLLLARAPNLSILTLCVSNMEKIRWYFEFHACSSEWRVKLTKLISIDGFVKRPCVCTVLLVEKIPQHLVAVLHRFRHLRSGFAGCGNIIREILHRSGK